jgi:tetratricopeptide (TPR) repeat protein
MTHGRRLALLVGTDQYADPDLGQLKAPQTDANALAAVLADPDIGGFSVTDTLLNKPHYEVGRRIEEFFGAARPNDLLLLYMSGHGVLAKNRQLYFAAANTDKQWLGSTAIGAHSVREYMDSSRSRQIVLLLDCCHSGGFGRPGLTAKGDRDVNMSAQVGGRGHVTLTASTDLEYAFEANGIKHLGDDESAPASVFTHHVITGLRTWEADVDGDDEITVDELYDYLTSRVVGQRPTRIGTVEGDIVLARRPGGFGSLPPDVRLGLRSEFVPFRVATAEALAPLRRQSEYAAVAERALEHLAADAVEEVAHAAKAVLGSRRRQAGSSKTATTRPDSADDAPEVHALLARAHAQRLTHRLSVALADADKAVALRPDSAAGYLEQGWTHLSYAKGHHRGAVASFERAATLDPGSAEAFAGTGLARIFPDQRRFARAALKQALKLDPYLAEAVAGQAALDCLDGRPGARERFDAAAAEAREVRVMARLASHLNEKAPRLETSRAKTTASTWAHPLPSSLPASQPDAGDTFTYRLQVGQWAVRLGISEEARAQLIDRLAPDERPLWLARCARRQDLRRSVALLVTDGRLIVARQTLMSGVDVTILALREVESASASGGIVTIRLGDGALAFDSFNDGIVDIVKGRQGQSPDELAARVLSASSVARFGHGFFPQKLVPLSLPERYRKPPAGPGTLSS